MLKISPPTHQADAAHVLYVSALDGAWDIERITADREKRLARADKGADPSDAVAACPVVQYHAGKTRGQIDAPAWDADGKPCSAGSFLREGVKPSTFGLRRLGYRAFGEVLGIVEPRARLVAAARLGLRSIDADGYTWAAAGDALATDEQLEALHAANPALLTEIGGAVLALSRPLDNETETPR